MGILEQYLGAQKYRIPLVNVNVTQGQGILILALLVGGGYYAYQKGWLSSILGGAANITAVDTADKVDFDITPSEVRPNSYVTIQGSFKDKQGNPMTVKQAYYYLFNATTLNGKMIVSQGSLGNNISSFSQMIPTKNFEQGSYSVTVTDTPLTAAEIGPLSTDSGVFGSKARPGTPTSDSLVNPSAIGVTLS